MEKNQILKKKLVIIQIKNKFLLANSFEELQRIISGLKDLEIKISKIELATDTQDEYVYETMLKSLKYKNNFISLSGKKTQYYINFSDDKYESLTLQNSVMLLKVYNKFVEINLDKNRNKFEMYYNKMGFKKDEDITRLELSLKRSSSIDQDLIEEILKNNEIDFNKILLRQILDKIEVKQNSQIKKVIKDLNRYSNTL